MLNDLQITILKAAYENGGHLPAPKHSLKYKEASAYCVLHNIRAVKLHKDFSLTLKNEGIRVLKLNLNRGI